MSLGATLKFEKLNSFVTVEFWRNFAKLKVEKLKLCEDPIEIRGSFTASDGHEQIILPPRLRVDNYSLDYSIKLPARSCLCPGQLFNVNKTETFKAMDKAKTLRGAAMLIADDIESGAWIKNPNLLNRFILLSFGDLKKHNYIYWFGFPAIVPNYFRTQIIKPLSPIETVQNRVLLASRLETFLVKNNFPFAFLLNNKEEFLDFSQAGKPEEWFWTKGTKLCFLDISSAGISWHFRNLLVAVSYACNLDQTELEIVSIRGLTKGLKGSLMGRILVQKCRDEFSDRSDLKIVGLERNVRNKLGPRLMSLKFEMDSLSLLKQSVDLNLKLMRWRALPSLNLEMLKDTSCLLLGSGTLGCQVARTLMAWGVQKITFVDNGRVSFSNPARQSLYTFDDCKNGGELKARAAAKRLKEIIPSLQTEGHVLSILMPGHPPSNPKTLQEFEASYQKLKELIQKHDVIYMLTDSRESRWLPTVLGCILGKLVINVALGFSSWVIQRHGVWSAEDLEAVKRSPTAELKTSRLGCYFCNDIVAPRDSLSDRTLDQQCTVTRPGLAPVSSGIAVELMVALLHHPKGKFAPADGPTDIHIKTEHPLGLVPHQLRGYLPNYQTLILTAEASSCCSACSPQVVNDILNNDWDFVLQVLRDPVYLEDLTGVKKMMEEMDALALDFSEPDMGEDEVDLKI